MTNHSFIRMNKRGQIETIVVFFLVGLVTLGGIYYVSDGIVSENRYIGDTSTNLYYDLKTCETKFLIRENITSFKSKEEAINNGFKPASCSN